MVAEDLELTVETLRCREDREASGLVKKVRLVNFSPNSLIWSIWRQTLIFFSEFRRSSNLTLYLTYHCIHLIVCMILKSQKSFRSMRNPVRPPVGFFNRRLSTRQNSNSDKVSRHFHFLHLLWLSLSHWFASFLLSLSSSESSNAKPKRKHHRCGITHRVRCWEGRGNSGLL